MYVARSTKWSKTPNSTQPHLIILLLKPATYSIVPQHGVWLRKIEFVENNKWARTKNQKNKSNSTAKKKAGWNCPRFRFKITKYLVLNRTFMTEKMTSSVKSWLLAKATSNYLKSGKNRTCSMRIYRGATEKSQFLTATLNSKQWTSTKRSWRAIYSGQN